MTRRIKTEPGAKPRLVASLRPWALAVSAAALVTIPAVHAAGETTYIPGYCGGKDFTERPTFSTATDLPYLLAKFAEYTATPEQMYGHPADETGEAKPAWTNWYLEEDMRNSLGKLSTMRNLLEAENLWDTYRYAEPITKLCPPDAAYNRQVDGSCNDPVQTWMGAAGTRFGRNMHPSGYFSQGETPYDTLMTPNPREVSRVLMTRDEFVPVPFLNVLSAAWIQFQVHDWFNHANSTNEYWQVPLKADDPIVASSDGRKLGHFKNGKLSTEPVMYVPKTAADPTRTPIEAAMGPTFLNQVTQWWDGSQVYGSNLDTAHRLRTFQGGKLKVDANGLLPTAADGFEDTGFRQNWWLGLGLMHNLFTKEHNAIAEMLAAKYPWMTDEELYNKARMITAGVIVKIHTIEWTPAIIPNPALEVGMNVNWAGLNQYLDPPLPTPPSELQVPYRHVIWGIRGGPRELYKDPETKKQVPFAMTEEFVSVYRMHPLLPDSFTIRSLDGQELAKVGLEEVRNADARKLEEQYGMANLLYSFGIENPGQLVLNNYPKLLQEIDIPHVGKLDLAAVDILRDRERGVPRYNEFRRQLNLKPLTRMEELTSDPELLAKLKQVYGSDAGAIERVDTFVGTLAEQTRPTCYGFGETLFQVFTVIATRRLHGDFFYTSRYNADTYTQAGLDWIEAATMKNVLLRHYPELGNTGLANVTNAFYPWE